MVCSKCGKELSEGTKFCSNCGSQVSEVAPADPPVPPEPQAAQNPPEAFAPQIPSTTAPMQPPVKNRRSKVAIILSGAGLVAVAALVLVLVLVFVVFKGENPGGTVDEFFAALEKNDIEGVLATVDIDYFQEDEELEEAFIERVLKLFAQGKEPEYIDFSGLKYVTTVDGDTATVEVTEGAAAYRSDEEEGTFDLSEPEARRVFYLDRKGDDWCISQASFGDIWAEVYLEKGNLAYESFGTAVNGIWKMRKYILELEGRTSSDALAALTLAQALTGESGLDGSSVKNDSEEARKQYEMVLGLESGKDIDVYRDYVRSRMELIDVQVRQSEVLLESLDLLYKKLLHEEGIELVADVDAHNKKHEEGINELRSLIEREDELEEKIEDMDLP